MYTHAFIYLLHCLSYFLSMLLPQVICSEGNSGFYEIGAMVTPIEAGYSVLGWNHPGFWGSTVSTNKC